MSVRKDETGNIYGRLSVTCYGGTQVKPSGQKYCTWVCLCACGNVITVAASALRQGATQSCGCLQKERASSSSKKHGASRSPSYSSYRKMLERCLIESCAAYENYGGRGITVCDRWLESYENFLEDMGERPEGLSLDRIDNSLGYSVENCRWATKSVQGFNRRAVNNTSGKIGVVYNRKRDKWDAVIKVNNKNIYLGRHAQKEDAIAARQQAELQYYGVIKG